MGKLRLGEKADLDEAVRLAEEANKLARSDATWSTLFTALAERLHQDIIAKNPSYAAKANKTKRTVGASIQIALLLSEDEAARKELAANPDLMRLVRMIQDRAKAYPAEGSVLSWALLRHLDPPAAERMATVIREDECLRLFDKIETIVDPLNISAAYEEYWRLQLEGKADGAAARLHVLADKGVALVLPAR